MSTSESVAKRGPTGLREGMLMNYVVTMSVLDRAYRSAANHAVAHVGLSQAMAWPLVMIGRHGDGLRQGVVADLLGIEGPSLARSLDQLAEGGFIERRVDSADRRAKTMHLTPVGLAACVQIEAALNQLRADVFDGVSDDDIAATLRVFHTAQKRLGCAQPVVPLHRAGETGVPQS